MPAAVHHDMDQLSRLCCANYRSAQEQSLLTDAFVAANNADIATFDAAIGNISTVHAEILAQRSRLQRAFRYDNATQGIGDVTNTNIASTSTVTALEALTQGASDNARLLVLE